MKKGFAISGLVYSILILFLILIVGILGILGSRKLILDKMKNNLMGELNNELVNNVYIDDSGANYPKLIDSMIPVIYDESSGNWVYANIYEKWYDYDEKMWANAVVLKDGVVKTVGQKINEDEIALMYVWIPRFKYVMFNANNEEVLEQQIDVIFENAINSTGTIKCFNAINQKDSEGNLISEICTDITNGDIVNNVSTYTHPAFTFGAEEITGFWVGKFENSTTDEECLNEASEENCNKSTHIIEIKANSDSLRYINISNMFTSIQNINVNYGINDADSHMIKNMEWGAIAYLKQSKYGLEIGNIGFNNYDFYKTGCGNVDSSETANICNTYNTNQGMLASTTGNVYGVYDMSGGAWEYVMGNMVNNNGTWNPSSAGFLSNLDSKYYDLYTYDSVNTSHSRGKLGDATKEIKKIVENTYGGWYDDNTHFVNLGYNWFIRSAGYSEQITSGIFYYGRQNGAAYEYYSSRSILVKK